MVLEDGQQLALERRRQEPDLVEEHRAAVRGLDEPGLGDARVREGAALVTEELGLEQRLGNRGAVDVDERARATGPGLVDGPGQESLARAGLAEDEDRAAAAGAPVWRARSRADLSADRLDPRAPALKGVQQPCHSSPQPTPGPERVKS